MEPYQLNIPTRVYFGRNIWKEALKAQESFVQGNLMIVSTGRSLVRLGYLEELKRQIEKCSLVKKVIEFNSVSANPRLSEIRAGIHLGKQEGIKRIIGFGGGSAIDAAKAIAVGIGTDEDIGEFYYNGKELGRNTLPILAIPTTAGTGSELSKAAIITDELQKIKNGIRGEALYPTVAIVDSVFTESVPFQVTMETGFDVLAHAVESYISKASSPYTQMQSEYVIRSVGKYLPQLSVDLKDVEAREKMSFASMIMGINLGNAGTCLPHRMQYPLGAHTDTSHGAGLAALYTAWIDFEYSYVSDKIEKVLELLTEKNFYGEISHRKNSVENLPTGNRDCSRIMNQFIKSLQLPTSLQELGAERSQLAAMASEVTGNIKNDPAAQEDGVILKIYEMAWQEKN